MTRPPLLSLLLAAVIASVGVASGAGRGPLVGGWSPIANVSDAHIQDLGAWAVARHANQTGDVLRFRRVTHGEQQVVAGMNYRLELEVTDPLLGADSDLLFEAVVYEQAWTGALLLTSFEPAPLVGSWRQIQNVSGDPQIQELGAWAVAQHVMQASDGLRFLRVTRGQQQVVAGMSYRLLLDVADVLVERNASYVAAVYEQVWTNTRRLTSFKPAPAN